MLYNNQNRQTWMSICQCVMFLKIGWKIKKTHTNNSQHLKWDDDMWHFAEWVSFGDSILHILCASGSVLWCSHFCNVYVTNFVTTPVPDDRNKLYSYRKISTNSLNEFQTSLSMGECI